MKAHKSKTRGRAAESLTMWTQEEAWTLKADKQRTREIKAILEVDILELELVIV